MSSVDLFGYLSSLVILISLTMSSIVRLRWINLVGAGLFTVFGFLVNSVPTAFLNFGIVLIDIYYLFKLYKQKESFNLIETTENSELVDYFYKVNSVELKKYFGTDRHAEGQKVFLMLRNNSTAGILVGREEELGTLFIDIDFVSSEYRDFKLGNYFFNINTEELIKRGYKKVCSKATHEEHKVYLEKMGFKKINQDLYEKSL